MTSIVDIYQRRVKVIFNYEYTTPYFMWRFFWCLQGFTILLLGRIPIRCSYTFAFISCCFLSFLYFFSGISHYLVNTSLFGFLSLASSTKLLFHFFYFAPVLQLYIMYLNHFILWTLFISIVVSPSRLLLRVIDF